MVPRKQRRPTFDPKLVSGIFAGWRINVLVCRAGHGNGRNHDALSPASAQATCYVLTALVLSTMTIINKAAVKTVIDAMARTASSCASGTIFPNNKNKPENMVTAPA